MARVTVEDCVTRVPNRFELVMLAAQRGRNIGAGAPLTLDRDNDKNAVVALREIADAKVDLKELENGLIRGCRPSSSPTSRRARRSICCRSARTMVPVSPPGSSKTVASAGWARKCARTIFIIEDAAIATDAGAALDAEEDVDVDVESAEEGSSGSGDDEPETL